MRVLSKIEPGEIWFWFEEISRIPRPSGSEKEIADFLVDFAGKRNLSVKRDDVNNVLITSPGRGNAASHPSLVLQAHVDIVPEKTDDSSHNFTSDPIVPETDGDWVTSKKTTLGADNGIGVALMLAVLDSDDIPHPFLECLFTTDEERGLTGAAHLDSEWITSKRLINLDSEDEGVFTIGCAGGLDFTVSMNFERMDITAEYYRLEITGLRGGHSGMEISKNRGNAIRFLGRILHKICSHHNCLIADIEGGSKRNAIPRTAAALISIKKESVDAVRELIQMAAKELKREFEGIEEGIGISLHSASTDRKPVSRESSTRIINLLLSMPHGVEKMSGVVPGLVETSVNMAIASMKEEMFILKFAARSPVDSAKQALAARAAAIAELASCDFRAGSAYPGWMPEPDSALLRKMVNIYMEVTGNEPVIETIHAGLECGIIGDRISGMEMISIGPDIRDVHIPGEKVSISSLQRFWNYFKSVLEFLN